MTSTDIKQTENVKKLYEHFNNIQHSNYFRPYYKSLLNISHKFSYIYMPAEV